ncbi:hypothetical protein DM02DRAFT_257434 [Periconia macrospinosa]|uniref:Uncharacterized protein n=1 Tax=Periconia macrospinosa TaxID=97972 RepID=A0A2V1DYU6_9PLEO|nr:hypothetical protein DM02DRAFT_257434 [Periconia macrospinosa]
MKLNETERKQRIDRFEGNVRLLVNALQHLTSEIQPHKSGLPVLTMGFYNLLLRSKQEYLVDLFLQGVPESTKLVLGKQGFTIADLLSLPRLSASKLSEHTVYIDCLEYAPKEDGDWRLYVGSATGSYGALQRWLNYLCPSKEKFRHTNMCQKKGRRVHLRSLSHYGFDPEPWLAVFAESIFMLYLGTVDDPRATWTTWAGNNFCHDLLYSTVEKVRSSSNLDQPLRRGLNSTWSLAQGWRGGGFKPGTKCHRCGLRVDDPSAKKKVRFYHTDPSQPSASDALCHLCYDYKRRMGKDRPDATLHYNRPPRIDHGTPCRNCGRVAGDPSLGKMRFHYTDPKEASPSNVLCNTCYDYKKKRGTDRPARLFQK